MADKNDEMAQARQEIHAMMDQLAYGVPSKFRQFTEEAIAKIKVDHALPKDALGIPPHIMDVIYRHGYNQFQAGKYQEALKVFNFLREMDVSDIRYSFAIAACHQYAKDYFNAATNYMVCNYLDPHNPIPFFHLFDCFMKADSPLPALYAIQQTLTLTENKPEFANLREKALLENNHLQQSLKTFLKKIRALKQMRLFNC